MGSKGKNLWKCVQENGQRMSCSWLPLATISILDEVAHFLVGPGLDPFWLEDDEMVDDSEDDGNLNPLDEADSSSDDDSIEDEEENAPELDMMEEMACTIM